MSEQIHPGKLVLLVEDSVVNQKLLGVMLEREGFGFVLANNGVDAVELFRHREFDLVLMDIQMPKMDGLEATRQIRQHEIGSGTHTPIIAVTAGMDRASCLNAGMDEYIKKPVRVDILHDILSRSFYLVRE
jgi:CheY-like chemotaxis protein